MGGGTGVGSLGHNQTPCFVVRYTRDSQASPSFSNRDSEATSSSRETHAPQVLVEDDRIRDPLSR